MLRRAVVALSTMILVAGLGAGPAGAATHGPTAGRSLAHVSILPNAHLIDDGAAIAVRLRVRCQPDGTNGIQWEGYISARQGDVFAWAGVPLICDGRQHVTDVALPVSAPPETAWFTRGRATVLVSIVDENTLIEYATDTRTVKLRGERAGPHHPGS